MNSRNDVAKRAWRLRQGLAAGMNEFIMKPVIVTALQATLLRSLEPTQA